MTASGQVNSFHNSCCAVEWFHVLRVTVCKYCVFFVLGFCLDLHVIFPSLFDTISFIFCEHTLHLDFFHTKSHTSQCFSILKVTTQTTDTSNTNTREDESTRRKYLPNKKQEHRRNNTGQGESKTRGTLPLCCMSHWYVLRTRNTDRYKSTPLMHATGSDPHTKAPHQKGAETMSARQLRPHFQTGN